MNLSAFREFLRHQFAAADAPPVGTPPARIEVLTPEGGKRTLVPTKSGRGVDAPGRTTHQEQSDEHHE